VFDKTGTLTQPGAFDIRFDAVSADLSDADRRAIATLAGESTHPLSRAVAKWLGEAFHEMPAEFTEQTGPGCCCRYWQRPLSARFSGMARC
jgi:Cu+-exporting ATPase